MSVCTAFAGVFTGAGEGRRDVHRLAERDEDTPAKPLASRETEPDRNDREASRGVRLVAERDPRRPRLDLLPVRLRAGGALGVDGNEPSAVEGRLARGEHLHVALSPASIVRPPVHRNRSERQQGPRDDGIAKEPSGREVLHLPWEQRSHEQRVDQVVRVVDAEQHRTRARDPFGVPDLDALEEEPHPEARHHPHDGIERVHDPRSSR